MTWHKYSATELEREYTPASRVANIQTYLDDYATRATMRAKHFLTNKSHTVSIPMNGCGTHRLIRKKQSRVKYLYSYMADFGAG